MTRKHCKKSLQGTIAILSSLHIFAQVSLFLIYSLALNSTNTHSFKT